MIDSDIPNADSRLSVRFYSKPLQNDFQTALQGRPIFEDVDFVSIHVPGDNTLVIDTPAREDHKKRFPLHWAHYQNNKGDGPANVGTPITQWPLITASQAEELKALKFYTVESIASASDAQLQRLGMLAGMSPFAFRERAMRFLKVSKDEAALSHQEDELKALKEENARIKAEMDEKLAKMQEQMEQLSEHKKPGRPRKEPEAA